MYPTLPTDPGKNCAFVTLKESKVAMGLMCGNVAGGDSVWPMQPEPRIYGAMPISTVGGYPKTL